MKNSPARFFVYLIGVYAIYFALTVLFADYVFPPARQSLVFQDDVLSGRYGVKDAKVLILGDSTAVFGYSAGSLPHTLSLAVFSGSFAEMDETLKRYLEKFPAPKCVLLTASYNWSYHRDGRFWDIYALNGFYGFSDLNEIYNTSASLNDFPANELSKAGFFVDALLYRMRLRGVHLTDVQDGLFKHQLARSNHRFYALMHENAGSINKSNVVFPFIWDPHVHVNEAFATAPMYDEYLRRLVKRANDAGASVHWVQSPISAQLLTPAAREFYKSLNEHLRPIVTADSRNTYDGETKIYDDKEMFSATHLNIDGAHRFTEFNRPLVESCQ